MDAPRPFADRFSEARQEYYKGIAGDKTAAEANSAQWNALSAERPGDPRVEAYFGSSRLFEAARTLAIWRKHSLSKEGLQHLDHAVESAPGDLEVRFVRAMTTYHLPSFFGRAKQSAEDFAILAPRVRSAATSGKLDPNLAAATLYYYGLVRADQSDQDAARASWQAAHEIGPNTRAGIDAAARLRKMGWTNP